MPDKQINVGDCSSGKIAKRLLLIHSIGGFRNEDDMVTAQHYAMGSVNFAIEIIKKVVGSDEEKITLLESMLEELPKFKPKK